MDNSKSKAPKQIKTETAAPPRWFRRQLIAALEGATANDVSTLVELAKDLRDKALVVDIIRLVRPWMDEGLTSPEISSVLSTMVDSLNADEPETMTLSKMRAVLAVARKDAQDRQRRKHARRSTKRSQPRKAQKVTA